MSDQPPPPYRNVEINPLNGRLSYRNKEGRRFPISPLQPPLPPDGNTYPLRMQPVANPGDPVTLGVGPDRIQMQLSGNPDSSGAGMNAVNVLLDGKLIATELMVSSFAGQGGGQLFTLQGTWGPFPHKVTLASALIGPGLKDMWITAVIYNGVPLVYNGPSVDARGAMPPPNAVSLWDNIGANVDFSDTHVVVPVPPPAPSLTLISGATRDGQPAEVATLAGLLERTQAGSVLQLPPGRIIGTSAIGAVTLKGAGIGQTVLDATGLPVVFGKAVLVPTVSGAVIEDLTITGAAGPDKNAAGVRQQGVGIDFTLNRVEIFGCQNGILAFQANVVGNDCYTHANGAGDGRSHDMYFTYDGPRAEPLGSVTLNNHRSVCGKLSTHALKSRYGSTVVNGGSFTGSSAGSSAIDGSVIDVPDGGKLKISETTVIQGAGTSERELIGYAMESVLSGVAPVDLDHVTVTISAENGYVVTKEPTAALVIGDGCTYTGTVAPTLQGWSAASTGAFTPAPVATT